MTDQMILDKMSQMLRLGFVNARQPEKMRVKVTLPDTPGSQLVTDWLPVLCPRACGDLQFDLPDIGDQVLCLFLAYGLEQGFVIGSMYGRQTPPVTSGDKWHRTFSDGGKLEYDRASHTLMADIPGTATIKCAQSITLEAPIIYVRGTLQTTAQDGSPGKSVFSGGMEVMNGGINAMDGDIVASGVSLASHTTEGVEPGNGISSHPTGGSADSPGTAAMAIPAIGTADFALYAAKHLDALTKSVEKNGTDTDKTILCLPDIAENMANYAEDEDIKKAWLLLKSFFEKWLSAIDSRIEDNEPAFINKNWILNHERVKKEIDYLKNNIISNNFKKQFTEKLKKLGLFTGQDREFDFIGYETPGWDEPKNWKTWNDNHSQSRAVPGYPWALLDDVGISLGGFTIKALLKGNIKYLGSNEYKICISELAIFASDKFEFKGWQTLGCWSCERLEFTGLDCSEYNSLNNADFPLFKKKHHAGGDFWIFSQPELVEDFKGDCYNARP